MSNYLIKNTSVINEGNIQQQDVFIKNGRFEKIGNNISTKEKVIEIDGEYLHLLPGLMDDQVHFREPGLTHKACIATEALAAVAGGVTSFMEMPNVIPPTLNIDLLEQKFEIAKRSSVANYSFFLGVSNDNSTEALAINKHKNEICGLKIFMGSSTGNMLVDNIITLEKIFSECEVLIATHCEREDIVVKNLQVLKDKQVDYNHARFHPIIRNEEACYESSVGAIQLAKKYNTRLHILHITTENELQLFTNLFPLAEKRITSEVCVHHLHFTANDYDKFGNLIKCNPAIKASHHREALWQGLLDHRLDIIATDHAPHTWEEKNKPYTEAPAGLPLVQHSLLILLEAYHAGRISLPMLVEKACHAPAICFQVKERGYIREGYHADAVMVNLKKSTSVEKSDLFYRCGWSPFEGHIFPSTIERTFVNGNIIVEQGKQVSEITGSRLEFVRD